MSQPREWTITIEGMTCQHCAMSVNKALGAVDGVENVEVDHETGRAVVRAGATVTAEALGEAVTAKGYSVTGAAPSDG